MTSMRGWVGFLVVVCSIGCRQEESRWEAAQQATQDNAVAVAESALPGSAFNRFFPSQSDEIDLVFKQE